MGMVTEPTDDMGHRCFGQVFASVVMFAFLRNMLLGGVLRWGDESLQVGTKHAQGCQAGRRDLMVAHADGYSVWLGTLVLLPIVFRRFSGSFHARRRSSFAGTQDWSQLRVDTGRKVT